MKRPSTYHRLITDELDAMGITHRVVLHRGETSLRVNRNSMRDAFPLISEGDAYDKVLRRLSTAIDPTLKARVDWDTRTNDEFGLSIYQPIDKTAPR